MKKKAPMALLFILSILLFALSSLAITEEAGPAGFTMYYNDAGNLLLGINPDDLNAVFGADYWEAANGFLNVYYDELGARRNFGQLSGLVVVDRDRKAIEVSNGAYNAPTSQSNPIRIEGKEFAFQFLAPDRGTIFSITGGIYVQGKYFIGCMPTTSNDPECAMKVFVVSYDSLMSIEGNGFITHSDNRGLFLNEGYEALKASIEEKKAEGEDVSEEDVYPISNMQSVQILDSEIFSMIATPKENAVLGEWAIASEEVVHIFAVKMGEFAFTSDDLYASANSAQPVPSILAKTKTRNANVLIETPGYDATIELESGFIMVTGEEEKYNRCEQGIACFLFKGDTLRIKPQAFRGEEYEPLWVTVTIPERITNVELDAFDTAGSESWINHVKIRRAGVSELLAFYNGEIIVSPGGNWFNLRTDFKAHIEGQRELYEGELSFTETVRSGFYDVFECTYRDQKCYLNGVQVQGFTEQHAIHFCKRDSECDAERRCIKEEGNTIGFCVRRAICTDTAYAFPLMEIPGLPEAVKRNIRSASKLDIVFIADEYGSETEFDRDLKKAVDSGLFAVSPFKENVQKFLIYKMNGGSMPFLITNIGLSFLYEAREMKKQCAGAEYAIVISKKNFGSFETDGFVSISQRDLYNEKEGGALVVPHEFGHAFGNLYDEYYLYDSTDPSCLTGFPNCLEYDDAKTSWGEDLANQARRNVWKGCGGYCNDRSYAEYLKPAANSIMGILSKPGHTEFSPPGKQWLANLLLRYT
ncbi:MAG: hypothetical protein KJ955_08060 [Nanoarchaeota archaeon]|nr:hypothetical protein [Nanoarchaeota archaeon]